ncbi:MAG: RNA polymerase sigma factor [Chitinophagaceae bacterium]
MALKQEFIQLINTHQRIIYKVCNLYMNNSTDKEDLFQEVCLQAWKAIDSFKGESQFSTWLYRVALNTAITFIRKDKRKAPQTLVEEFPEVVDETSKEKEEQLIAMYKAIGNLSKIDKALVMLYLEDFSYIEIGKIMGITPNNVAVKMNRLKVKLKEETEKHYQF